MSDTNSSPKTGSSPKKAWRSPQIIDAGSIDEQTTAGVGNVGDKADGDKWKALTIDAPAGGKVILPPGD
ncbi:hypothetical protein GCM10007973_03930 [Polymorphobacter multimanifer]|uniref:Uncharacterized protein n=1 Tax=Polymorphobacter multimanifer TaxID=1070431 RepID=A0A841LGK0_9SPHN|nr:hypothetical protein [Polymorphobacter multimanifer]MBB6228098.1 hypothetical protein [Polymorphobacter multimanifer]GGI70136.1 hypothetical protein GCM10007973_03930 [Polymorphobacter multimanifer]